jgi:hypothetical protein
VGEGLVAALELLLGFAEARRPARDPVVADGASTFGEIRNQTIGVNQDRWMGDARSMCVVGYRSAEVLNVQ